MPPSQQEVLKEALITLVAKLKSTTVLNNYNLIVGNTLFTLLSYVSSVGTCVCTRQKAQISSQLIKRNYVCAETVAAIEHFLLILNTVFANTATTPLYTNSDNTVGLIPGRIKYLQDVGLWINPIKLGKSNIGIVIGIANTKWTVTIMFENDPSTLEQYLYISESVCVSLKQPKTPPKLSFWQRWFK
jgi:hypothetical protein